MAIVYVYHYRTRRLLTEGRARSSGAAKVAQIIQKDVGNVKMDDTIGDGFIYACIHTLCKSGLLYYADRISFGVRV